MQPGLIAGGPPSPKAFDCIGAQANVELPRHRWYFVKEAFSRHVVTSAIEDAGVKRDDVVLDPFAGSGTVPLSCSEGGIRGVGIEVNPFLAAVARAKLLQDQPETVRRHAKTVYRGAARGARSPLESFSTFSESGGFPKWLFNQGVLRAFEGGWRETAELRPPVGALLRLALVGAAMDVCNAVKDGKCLRYRRDWKAMRFDERSFRRALETRVDLIVEDLEAVPLVANVSDVVTGDARSLLSTGLDLPPFKLCVTSPPYLNSFDYTDVYRPELFLGRFVESMKGLRALRLRTLRSHTQVKWEDPKEIEFGPHFEPVFEELLDQQESLWNRRIPKMVCAYFEDMRAVLRQLKRLARKDASLWIVVSTSAYAGVEIPVDHIIADIACREGWHLREVRMKRFLRRVPVQQWKLLEERSDGNGPHLRESIVILDSSPPSRRLANDSSRKMG